MNYEQGKMIELLSRSAKGVSRIVILEELKIYIQKLEDNAILYDWGASTVLDMLLDKIEEMENAHKSSEN